MINFYQIETTIISRNAETSFIDDTKVLLAQYKNQIEYNCTRFIDQYGSKLDIDRPDKYHKFIKIQNEEYAKITRLTRIINAYTK